MCYYLIFFLIQFYKYMSSYLNKIKSIKNNAIFPPVENPKNNSSQSLLQKFIYSYTPNSYVQQKRTCIKFKYSATTKNTILFSPNHKIYHITLQIFNLIRQLLFFLKKQNHSIKHISIHDIHFFNNEPTFINPNKIAPINICPKPNSVLAAFIKELSSLYPKTHQIPPLSPIGKFINLHYHY